MGTTASGSPVARAGASGSSTRPRPVAVRWNPTRARAAWGSASASWAGTRSPPPPPRASAPGPGSAPGGARPGDDGGPRTDAGRECARADRRDRATRVRRRRTASGDGAGERGAGREAGRGSGSVPRGVDRAACGRMPGMGGELLPGTDRRGRAGREAGRGSWSVPRGVAGAARERMPGMGGELLPGTDRRGRAGREAGRGSWSVPRGVAGDPGAAGRMPRERRWRRRRRRLGGATEPAAVAEPAAHRPDARGPGGSAAFPFPETGDHLRGAVAGCEQGLRLTAEVGPRVRAGEVPGQGAVPEPRAVEVEGPGAPGGEAPRAPPHRHEAGDEVPPGPPALELLGAVVGAQPHADPAGEVQLRATSPTRPHADRTRGELPERFPLVEAPSHRRRS
jgi:hypothetical protein